MKISATGVADASCDRVGKMSARVNSPLQLPVRVGMAGETFRMVR
jgi:hypothetical protein